MLDVRNLAVSYDGVPALHDVSFQVEQGKIVSLIGSNGAGKSTTMRTISGLLQPNRGEIYFEGERIERTPAFTIAAMGIAHVPEGRRLFSRQRFTKSAPRRVQAIKSRASRRIVGARFRPVSAFEGA